MSLASWWRGFKDRRQLRRIARHKKAIKNRYGQGDDRARAIAFFQGLGGRDGHLGLLERFMVNAEPSIRDEEEKEDLFHTLVELGPEVIPAIADYLKRKDAATVPISWPLKVLRAVAGPAEAAGVIIGALEEMGVAYTREPERKVELVAQLAELEDPRVVAAVVPFLHDHRDEVRLQALDVLTRKADEAAREPMLELLTDEESPLRLRASVADALQRLGWSVKGFRKRVEDNLPEGLGVDRSGKIKGRWVNAPSEAE
jgi:hypothetical protein